MKDPMPFFLQMMIENGKKGEKAEPLFRLIVLNFILLTKPDR